MIFIVMILILGLIVGIGLFITMGIIKNINSEGGELESIKEEDEELRTITSRDFIPLKKIYGPIAQVSDEEYMVLIETGPKNFFLLNEEGFDRLDIGFSELCLSLDEEEEIIGYVANEFLDEKSFFDECINNNKKNKHVSVRNLINSVLKFFEERTVGQLARRNFIILSYNTAAYQDQIEELKTEESLRDLAADKLLDRASMYVDILETKLGVPTKVLVGQEILEVFYKHINKNLAKELSLTDILEQETFSMYTTQMKEKVKHLTSVEELELTSLSHQENNLYIKDLQDDFERRLNGDVEHEVEYYKTIKTDIYDEVVDAYVDYYDTNESKSNDGWLEDKDFKELIGKEVG